MRVDDQELVKARDNSVDLRIPGHCSVIMSYGRHVVNSLLITAAVHIQVRSKCKTGSVTERPSLLIGVMLRTLIQPSTHDSTIVTWRWELSTLDHTMKLRTETVIAFLPS